MQWSFNGIGSFAHLDYVKCLTNPQEKYDIAIIGAPFDTAVSFRPGSYFRIAQVMAVYLPASQAPDSDPEPLDKPLLARRRYVHSTLAQTSIPIRTGRKLLTAEISPLRLLTIILPPSK